jgi:hypothetical protein
MQKDHITTSCCWMATRIVMLLLCWSETTLALSAVSPQAVRVGESSSSNRRHVLLQVAGAVPLLLLPLPSHAKSYSQNARNMERLNAGDSSGGSMYDNNPTSESGKRRRAMTGCKIPSAREEAALPNKLSEKECNQKVLAGETDFMLQALEALECPACPYGVGEKKR